MALVFAWRSNTTSAYYAPGGELSGYFDSGQTNLAQIVTFDTTSCIGGQALDFASGAGSNSWRVWNGIGNTPTSPASAISVVLRFAAPYDTSPTFNSALFQMGGNSGLYNPWFGIQIENDGDLIVRGEDQESLTMFTGTITSNISYAGNNVMNDLVMVIPDTTTSNVEVFINGSTAGAVSLSRTYDANGQYPFESIWIGKYQTARTTEANFNEVLIFNHALTGASIASAFPGASRTSFYSTTVNQPSNSTDPGVANVVGVSYTFKGDSLTGTYSTPTYSDPGIANVANGTNYIFNDATLTGTLAVPTASTGTAGTVPLGELKEQIRYVLAQNNTSTGAPTQDLSENLSRQVQVVMKVNPDRLGPPDDNVLPAVTVFTDSKAVEPVSIAVNGLQGKRRARVTLKVMGMVWEPYTTDNLTDPADNECENLMENIERILRAYDTLGGNVQWHIPTSVTYHSFQYSEDTHFRAGILDLQATLYY